MKKTALLLLGLALFMTTSAQAFVVFEEYFDGPGLPAYWTFDQDGQWANEDGTLGQLKTSTSAHADCEAGDLNWTDYIAQTNFKYTQFGSGNMEAGMIIRGTWNQGGVVLRTSWRGYWNLELLRPQMQELHVPLNQNLSTGQWYTMRTLIEGDYLKVWVNDILYDFGDISPEGTPIPDHGFIGLWANNAHVNFDNVLVDNMQVNPIPEPATLLLLGTGVLSLVGLRKKLTK